MSNYIDLHTLHPSVEAARLRAELLNLFGYLVPEDKRLALLHQAKSGDRVLSSPIGFPFWRGLNLEVELVDALSGNIDGLSWRKQLPPAEYPPVGELEHLGERPKGEVYERKRLTVEEAVSRLAGPANCAIGLDVETDVAKPGHPNENDDTLVGVGISFGDESGYYAPIKGRIVNPHWWVALVEHLHRWPWIGHNAKYDYVILKRHGITPGPIAGDGMLGLYLLGEREAKLKDAVLERYNYKMATYEELTGSQPISKVDPDKVFNYNLDDCVWGRHLALDVEGELSASVRRVYRELDLPLISILGDMQIAGFQLDRPHALEELDKYGKLLSTTDGAVDFMAQSAGYHREPKQVTCKTCHNGSKKRLSCVDCDGQGKYEVPQALNPGSNTQLVAFLHDHLKLPVEDLTKGGKPSVSKLALLKLKDKHEVVPLIIRRRAAEKYIGYLREWLVRSERDSRVHTVLTNAWVRSGRLSSRDPNLTQVAVEWRDNFTGNLFTGDYQQLEIRCAAFLSRDPALLRIVNADPDTPGGDLHGQTMHNVFKVPLEEHKLHPEIRLPAKTYMFAKLYGGGGFVVRQQLEKVALEHPELDIEVPNTRTIDKRLAAISNTYPRYFKEYVPYRIYMTREEQDCWAYTPMGRPRYLPDLRSPFKELREAAERECISHHVQGFAADLVREAMKQVAGLEHGRMILQVHDEIVSELDSGWEIWYAERAKKAMELGQPLNGVPLVVETSVAENWKEAHK